VGLSTNAHAIPRFEDAVSVGAEDVGEVTSGGYSPVLEHPIAMAYVIPPFAEVGQTVSLTVHGSQVPAQVVDRPFYRRGVTLLPLERADRRSPGPRTGRGGGEDPRI
jgi:aminomethyltransferase